MLVRVRMIHISGRTMYGISGQLAQWYHEDVGHLLLPSPEFHATKTAARRAKRGGG